MPCYFLRGIKIDIVETIIQNEIYKINMSIVYFKKINNNLENEFSYYIDLGNKKITVNEYNYIAERIYNYFNSTKRSDYILEKHYDRIENKLYFKITINNQQYIKEE